MNHNYRLYYGGSASRLLLLAAMIQGAATCNINLAIGAETDPDPVIAAPSEPVSSGDVQSLTVAGPQLSIEPAKPTSADPVRLIIRDVWRDGCKPDVVDITPVGDLFLVNLETVKPGTLCTAAQTPFKHSLEFGKLAAGHYTVSLSVVDWMNPDSAGDPFEYANYEFSVTSVE